MVKIEAIRWRSFSSHQGRFEVDIPVGWTFKAFAPDEHSFGFTPEDRDLPGIGIGFTEANTMVLEMGLPMNQMITQKLTPEEFLLKREPLLLDYHYTFFYLIPHFFKTSTKRSDLKS